MRKSFETNTRTHTRLLSEEVKSRVEITNFNYSTVRCCKFECNCRGVDDGNSAKT